MIDNWIANLCVALLVLSFVFQGQVWALWYGGLFYTLALLKFNEYVEVSQCQK